MARNVLVVAPHTDDAELGCGGTLAKLAETGDRVIVVAFSDAQQSLPEGSAPDRLHDEMRASLKLLGVRSEDVFIDQIPVRHFPANRQLVLDRMIELRATYQPELVFAPSSHDVHQDHEVVHSEALRAFRRSAIWCYELPWNQFVIETTGFVRLEDRHVEAKIAALQCYASQVELKRPYFNEPVVRGLAALRGVQAFTPLAEAFQVIRAFA